MKIEIDLDDVFRDEDGNAEESLQDSIRRQVITRLEGDMRKRLFSQIDERLAAIMNKQISEVMTERMPGLIDDIMNTTYTPISTYGSRSAPTTFREEIIKAVASNMEYRPKNYSSEENAFTRAVKSIVEEQTRAFQKDLIAQIDDKFRKDALSFAVAELSKRLGLSK